MLKSIGQYIKKNDLLFNFSCPIRFFFFIIKAITVHDGKSLTESMHQRGINIRYLGRIAELSKSIGDEAILDLCQLEVFLFFPPFLKFPFFAKIGILFLKSKKKNYLSYSIAWLDSRTCKQTCLL